MKIDPDVDEVVADLRRRLEQTDGVCIAWSGGLDSSVLVDLALRARRTSSRPGELDLAAIHVDHGLREDSSRVAQFCNRRGHQLDLPCIRTEVRVPAERSTQAAARTARYAALATHARDIGMGAVWTAHHANDALETALLSWTQGTGAGGLASLAPNAALTSGAPVAGWGDLGLERPLSNLSKHWIRRYARDNDVDFREDPSNTSDDYLRNRLRRGSADQLEREAGSLEPLLQTLRNLADDDRALREQARRLGERARLPSKSRESLTFETQSLRDAPAAVLSRLFRQASRELPGPVRWRSETMDALVACLNPDSPDVEPPMTLTLQGATVHIGPEHLTLELERGRGDAARRGRHVEPIAVELGANPTGRVRWFDATLSWRIFERSGDDRIPEADDIVWFDRQQLPERLTLRGPRRGESFRPFGFDGDSSVRDVLRAAGIPEADRWRAPCLAASGGDDELLWICGMRRSAAAPVSSETDVIAEWQIKGNESGESPR